MYGRECLMLYMAGVSIQESGYSGDRFILPLANELDPSKWNAVNLPFLPNKRKGDHFVGDDDPTAAPRPAMIKPDFQKRLMM
jgi:hypothetical protein